MTPSADKSSGLPRWSWIVLVLVITVAGGLVLARSLIGRSTRAATQAFPSPAAVASEGQAVASALAGLSTDPQSLVATVSQRLMGGEDARRAIPEGTEVAADPVSWTSTGPGSGTIVVTLVPPGGAATTYLAAVLLEQGVWKVVGTIPLPEPEAAHPGAGLSTGPGRGAGQ